MDENHIGLNNKKPLLKAMVFLAEMERFELSRRVNDLYP